jgi:hypothetical protein
MFLALQRCVFAALAFPRSAEALSNLTFVTCFAGQQPFHMAASEVGETRNFKA